MANFPKQVSVHGKRAYVTPDSEIVARKGFVAGGEMSIGRQGGNVVLPGPNVVAVFEDFLGDTGIGSANGPMGWSYVEADTGGSMTGKIVSATNGVFRMTSSSQAGIQDADECQALSMNLYKNWKANQGEGKSGTLRIGARVKMQSASRTDHRQHVFVGFSDSGGAQMAAYDTGAGVGGVSDFVGFIHSPGGDTGWSLVARQDSGTAQVSASGESATSNKYDVVEVAIQRDPGDTGGTAYGYINGKLVAKISNPIHSAKALSPWVGFFVQDTGARYLDVDYINVSAPRDTGT